MISQASNHMPIWEDDETAIGEIRCEKGWMPDGLAAWASVCFAPRCGGYFCTDNHQGSLLQRMSAHRKAVLSWHIYQHNLQKELLPLDMPSVEEVRRKMSDRMNFAWITHEPEIRHEGQASRISEGLSAWAESRVDEGPTSHERLISLMGEIIRQTDLTYELHPQDARAFLYAAGACTNRNQLADMLKVGQERQWLRVGDVKNGPWRASWGARIWHDAQQREVLRWDTQEGNLIFVAMWLAPENMDLYYKALCPAIKAAGYSPYIANQRSNHQEPIDMQLMDSLRRSRLVVADFAHGGDGMRGSVYFEAGCAWGWDIPLIRLCREDQMSELAFDTRQYYHISWVQKDDQPAWREITGSVFHYIRQEIGQGPLDWEGEIQDLRKDLLRFTH